MVGAGRLPPCLDQAPVHIRRVIGQASNLPSSHTMAQGVELVLDEHNVLEDPQNKEKLFLCLLGHYVVRERQDGDGTLEGRRKTEVCYKSSPNL